MKISVAYTLPVSGESPGNLTKDEIVDDLSYGVNYSGPT